MRGFKCNPHSTCQLCVATECACLIKRCAFFLFSQVRADPTSQRAKALALELLAVASLQGGYSLEDPGGFAKSMIELLRREADRYLQERK